MLCSSQGCVLFAWDEGHMQQRISKKPQSPQCQGYNSEVRIKRLKCFVFSWISLERVQHHLPFCVSKIANLWSFLTAVTQYYFLSTFPLHTCQWVPVKGPVCTGTDFGVMKQSPGCFSVTLVSVGCVMSQGARTTWACFLPAQPHGSPGFPTSAVTFSILIHHKIWQSIRSIRRHGENLTSYFGVVWGGLFQGRRFPTNTSELHVSIFHLQN